MKSLREVEREEKLEGLRKAWKKAKPGIDRRIIEIRAKYLTVEKSGKDSVTLTKDTFKGMIKKT